MTAEVELRCENQAGMFGVIVRQGSIDPETNLVQFTCKGCREKLRAEGEQVVRVTHWFNPLGELVDTVLFK